MSQYLVLSRVKIQNANCIAGFTWGFPAITHFLGFTHAMQREMSSEFKISLEGCGIVSHEYQLRVYKPTPRANFEFLQSKNPPVLAKHKSASPPIIEEGKMNLTASMVIKVSKELVTNEDLVNQFKKAVLAFCLKNRLAGGAVLSVGQIDLLSASTEEQHNKLTKRIKQLTMPGFVLKDRSEYLESHFQQLKEKNKNIDVLDAWLDFSAIKYQAIPKLKENEPGPSLDTDADWEFMPKPKKGWLVPIMTGYKAISPLYPVGAVSNTRDDKTPARFVEAIHSIGEWQSIHRIKDINDVIWTYQPEDDWYICAQKTIEKPSPPVNAIEEIETLDFKSALTNL